MQPARFRWWRLVGLVLPLVLFIASCAKATSWPEWEAGVRTYTAFPQFLRDAMLWGVPVLELLPLVLVTAGFGRAANIFGTGMVALFTTATMWQIVMDQPPDCACFGEWLAFESRKDSWQFTIGRNAVLFVIGLAGILLWKRGERVDA